MLKLYLVYVKNQAIALLVTNKKLRTKIGLVKLNDVSKANYNRCLSNTEDKAMTTTTIAINQNLINEVIAVSHYQNAQEAVINILSNYLQQQKKALPLFE